MAHSIPAALRHGNATKGLPFCRPFMQEMNLLEYEIESCWREDGATKIRLASKPSVSAWASFMQASC